MPKSHKVGLLLSTFHNWRFQEIGFKKGIVDGTVFVSEEWCEVCRRQIHNIKRDDRIHGAFVLKYKEKPVIIRYFSHCTNRSPCLLQKSFSSCSSIAPLKSSEELHIEPLQISNGSPCIHVVRNMHKVRSNIDIFTMPKPKFTKDYQPMLIHAQYYLQYKF